MSVNIGDLSRMCKHFRGCVGCPLHALEHACPQFDDVERVSSIVTNWCKNNPVEQRRGINSSRESGNDMLSLVSVIIRLCEALIDTDNPFRARCKVVDIRKELVNMRNQIVGE